MTTTPTSLPVSNTAGAPPACATGYDEVADAYDTLIRPRYEAIALRTADAVLRIPRAGSSVVLELSAGTGALTRLLAPRIRGGYVATDLSRPMLAVARRRCARVSRIAWLPADVADVPLPSHLADVVVSSLGPVQDSVEALAEARRMLVPGGRFVACTWGNDYAELDLLQEARRRLDVEPRPVVTAADLQARTRRAGFRDVRVTSFRIPVVHASVAAYRDYRCAFGSMPLPDGVTASQVLDTLCDAAAAYVDSDGRVVLDWHLLLVTGAA